MENMEQQEVTQEEAIKTLAEIKYIINKLNMGDLAKLLKTKRGKL